MSSDVPEDRLSRRGFLARAGLTGGAAAVTGWGVSPWIGDVFHRRGVFVYPDRPATVAGVSTIFSACKQCGSDCGLAAEVFAGVLQKLDGNPYHPSSTEPHARYATSPDAAAVWAQPHSLCNRGQAGRQTLYDPLRLTLPLKRTGRRGSGSWETISWEQLISEVTSGGKLFAHVRGEENRQVDGFAALWDGGKGRTTPIDAADSGLGPRTNGLVIYAGFAEAGQTDFLSRFAGAFGTVNVEAADAICDLNRMQGTMQSLDGMTDPLKPDLASAEYVIFFGSAVMTGSFPMQAFGRKLAAAAAAGRLTYTLVEVRAANGGIHADRTVYVRPGGDGALAMGMIRWILDNHAYDSGYLALPGQDAATRAGHPTFSNASWLVVADPKHPDYGMFLSPGQAGLGAPMGGGNGGGMGQSSGPAGVVIDPRTRKPVAALKAAAGELWPAGDLSAATVTVNGVACRTNLQFLYQEAASLTIAGYAAEAGVSPALIETLAQQFTSHGRKAVADFGRGPAMHTNGFYAGRAIMTLNFLIGNIDWAGGYIAGGGGADIGGGYDGAPYPLDSWPGQPDGLPAGVAISRSGFAYESSAEYAAKKAAGKNPYPATRPWFPFGGGQWPEMFAGVYTGYPYPAKILFQHAANPAWSAPAIGGSDDRQLGFQRVVTDLDRVPLFIATDIVLSESAALADYVVPDTSYLECWEFPGAWPVVPTKTQGIRRPVVEPLTGRTPSGAAMCVEQFLIDVAKALGLPGFGKNAFPGGGALDTREDFYLKMVANIAYDTSFQALSDGELTALGPVPDGTPADLAAIAGLRRAHPAALTAGQWRKAAYVLARGGRFEDYEVAYLPNPRARARLTELVGEFVMDTGVDRWATAPGQITPAQLRASFTSALRPPPGPSANPDWMTYRYGMGGVPVQIYNPAVATAVNPYSGEMFRGTACYQPATDLAGRPLDGLDSATSFPFLLSTHKTTVLSHSQAIADPWLTELRPEGFIEMCSADADRLGLRAGDRVRVWSPTLPKERGIVGRLQLLSGLRMGVITFPHGYGHWQAGSARSVVNGTAYDGDLARAVPVRLNAANRLETSLAAPGGFAVGLMDPVTGCQAYFDTRVAIERA